MLPFVVSFLDDQGEAPGPTQSCRNVVVTGSQAGTEGWFPLGSGLPLISLSLSACPAGRGGTWWQSGCTCQPQFPPPTRRGRKAGGAAFPWKGSKGSVGARLISKVTE